MGTTQENDKLRAYKTTVKFFEMYANLKKKRKGEDAPKEFAIYLTEQFEAVRKEAKEEASK